MDRELISEFKARIVRANRSQLIVILYDMYFAYIKDALICYNDGRWEQAKEEIDSADAVLKRLQDDLNHDYQISGELHRLYQFCRKELALAKVRKSEEEIRVTLDIMRKLYVGMEEMVKADESKPLMQHSQQIYAGMTYGKYSLNEACETGENRGFLA